VGPRTRVVYMERKKILPPPGLEHRPFGRPVRSQSLYRYTGSRKLVFSILNIFPVFLRQKEIQTYVHGTSLA
jgi:hypothetical protein